MKGILIDITKCTGCEKCVIACITVNNMNPVLNFPRKSDDDLSGRKLLSLVQVSENRFVRKSCLHCVDPGCVNACICGALEKTDLGPVIYDADKCIGCRYCMLACPMNIPRYEWDETMPYVMKCDMCFDLLQKDRVPACIEACPNNVMQFGEREQLLLSAKKNIAASPDKYMHHIYGEKEFGGTSVIYITDVNLESIGWQSKIGERSIPSYTWPLISKTPILGLSVAGFLTGTFFIIRRRMELQDTENK